MTADKNSGVPSDADLVAYLDGELTPAESVRLGHRLAGDADLKKRLDLLLAGGRPFGEAFASLLDVAPKDRLDAMLNHALREPRPTTRRWGGARFAGFAAAAVIILAVGAGLDRVIDERGATTIVASRDAPGSADWRVAVADYLALYTRDTLVRIPAGTAEQERDVVQTGERLGLALSPAKVALADFALKRADLYDYDGKPLAFLAYLDPRQGLIALCIINGGEPAEPRVERRQGMNVVYWSDAGHRFMLVGHTPSTDLQNLAAAVRARFAGDAGRAG